jgi:hypothetical protein
VKIGHILVWGLLASGCGADERTTRPGPLRTGIVPDKDTLFGDPGLVPTRAGEHIRREIAVAGQIDRAILTLGGIEQARTNVELPREGEETPRVLVAARLDAVGDRPTLHGQIRSVIRGIVGEIPDEAVSVVLADPAAPRDRRPSALPVLLAAGLLGLGLSAGVAADRLRRRVRRRPSQRRQPR